MSAAAAVAGAGGLIIIARALGPTAREEYAEVTAWFGPADEVAQDNGALFCAYAYNQSRAQRGKCDNLPRDLG